MSPKHFTTTIAISRATKDRLDKWRADGQCYDSFLSQIVDVWEKTHINQIIKEVEA
jgi:hypothetical protein